MQIAIIALDSHTSRCAGEYFNVRHVLPKALTDDEFLEWSRGEGHLPWWHMGADKAPRPGWFVRLALADGSGYVVIQGESSPIASLSVVSFLRQPSLLTNFAKSTLTLSLFGQDCHSHTAVSLHCNSSQTCITRKRNIWWQTPAYQSVRQAFP